MVATIDVGESKTASTDPTPTVTFELPEKHETVNCNVAEPPPGDGFEMLPLSVPALASWDAGRSKRIDVFDVTTPVTPDSVAVVAVMKPAPLTVTAVAGAPELMDAGLTVDTVGVGFA